MPSGNTFNEYTDADGVKTDWDFTFDYLEGDHVILNVDGAESDQNTADNAPTAYGFTIVTTPTVHVSLNTAPPSGSTVRIYRNTLGLNNDDTTIDTTFVDGSVQTAEDLNRVIKQAIYLAIEKGDFQLDLADAATGAVLVYNATTGKWEVLPLNLQYDSTNETFGFGGTPSTTYKHKFYGDLLIRDDDDSYNGAVLTIENASTSGVTNAVLILASQSPILQLYDTNGSTDKKYFNIQQQDGTITFQPLTDVGASKATVPLKLVEDGGIIMPSLPTTDPSVTGEVWNRNGTVVMSGSSRYIYDSGWVTAWGGTTLAAVANGTETLSAAQGAYFPFTIQIWARLASSPNTVYPIDVNPVYPASPSGTVGIQAEYNESTRGLKLYFQDSAVVFEQVSGLGTNVAWGGGVDEIRVTIQ